ncbi:unnamed protein product [Brassica oleracea]
MWFRSSTFCVSGLILYTSVNKMSLIFSKSIRNSESFVSPITLFFLLSHLFFKLSVVVPPFLS